MVAPPQTWHPPRTTCIIATIPRSGSGLLCDLMTASGSLGRPAEFFNPGVARKLAPDDSFSAPLACRHAVEHGTSPNGITSLKIFTHQFAPIEQRIRLSEWFPSPRWIYLSREDIVAQAVSWLIAHQSGVWRGSRQGRVDLVYRQDDVDFLVQRILDDEAAWRRYFARNAIRPHRITYEQLASDPHGTITAICKIFGLDSPGKPMTPDATVQRTDINQEWAERYVASAQDLDKLRYNPASLPRRRTVR